MNKSAFLAAIVGVILSVSSANALTCFSNSYGSGCTSSLGTLAVTRDGAVAVSPKGDIHAYRRGSGFYAYNRGEACYWHNGQQICSSKSSMMRRELSTMRR